MNIQVLISTLNQHNYSLLEKMNIQSDVIMVNQCEKNEFQEFIYKEVHNIKMWSFSERGIGLSRNNAFMRATADICLFADEDLTYVDNYKEIIFMAFKKNPTADMVLFNVPSTNPDRPTNTITKSKRIRFYNCLKYGAVNIAVKTHKIREANVYFSLLFGGGAKYSAGEDSLFIAECIRKGIKVYTNPTIIGFVSQEKSSWFNGYTDKYFIDKGIFYYSLSKRLARILCLQFVLRHKRIFNKEKSVKEAYRLMVKGYKMMD